MKKPCKRSVGKTILKTILILTGAVILSAAILDVYFIVKPQLAVKKSLRVPRPMPIR